jgi:RNA polymerase sporulation-specific sigma factor
MNENPDERVLAAARAGDSGAMEFLLDKYRDLVQFRARSYFIIGADREDVIQEGMIGLYKAVRDFRIEKLASFRAFADLCITRQIITAIKTATRMKHVPLNQYVSLNKPVFRSDGDKTLVDILESPKSADPEDVLVKEEFDTHVRERMEHNLSDLESRVLALYLEGKTYGEMSLELNRHGKSIDNALQRLKRKIEKSLTELSVS